MPNNSGKNNAYSLCINDENLEILPAGESWVLEVGESTLTVKNGRARVSAPVDSQLNISITTTYVQTPRTGVQKTKCIDCNGKRYCITNGCANTPCGWICDS